jgi:hypothetical protein
MTTRKTRQNDQAEAIETTSDRIEEKLVAFAEQLGLWVGTVQAKAEGWLDRTALTKDIGRIRDNAAALLAQVNSEGDVDRKIPATSTAPPPPARNRGPVDAPGKRHRKPPPQEHLDKRMGEPRGKQMGQKSAKSGTRRGRG